MKNKLKFLAAVAFAVNTSTTSTPVCIKWNMTDPKHQECAESRPGPVITIVLIDGTPFGCQKASPTDTNCDWVKPLANALNKNK